MVPSSFDESNMVLGKPPDMDECEALSVWLGRNVNGIPIVVSCWKLTKEEVVILLETGRIWVTIAGETMPPIDLNIKSPFKE